MANNPDSFLWYDYETTGTDPRRDRPVQFAAVRTDLDLNIVEDPIDILCQPGADVIPDPFAVLLTGISPMKALADGLTEVDFSARIHQAMMVPGTCTLGYNSIRFDDEVSRFLFWRNLIDPYEREWKSGNSRWDLLDVARMCWALRPDGIQWPVGEDGRSSFRLELLTQANGIGHQKAHDAVSDVIATIEFARLIRQNQPKLFEYALTLRNKKRVQAMLDMLQRQPVLHISGRFPVEKGCMGVVVPMAGLPGNANGVICINLDISPDDWAALSAEDIRTRLYTTSADLAEQGLVRPPIKVIHCNKSPMVAPLSMLDSHVEQRFGINRNQLSQHYEMLGKYPELAQKLADVFARDDIQNQQFTDPEIALYDGFVSGPDRQRLNQIAHSQPFSIDLSMLGFQDKRLPELVKRYWCRNWPDRIPTEWQQYWAEFCSSRLHSEESGTPRTLAESESQLAGLQRQHPDKIELLNELAQFYQLQANRFNA